MLRIFPHCKNKVMIVLLVLMNIPEIESCTNVVDSLVEGHHLSVIGLSQAPRVFYPSIGGGDPWNL